MNNDNIIEYKSITPFFDMEISGLKPFTFRYADLTDPRVEKLIAWTPDKVLYIRIRNADKPKMYFIKRIVNVSYLQYFIQDVNREDYGTNIDYNYLIIHFDGLEYIESNGVITAADPAAAS